MEWGGICPQLRSIAYPLYNVHVIATVVSCPVYTAWNRESSFDSGARTAWRVVGWDK